MSQLEFSSFFDKDSNTFSYLVWDSISHAAVVIDPVLNFDQASGRTGTTAVEMIVKHIQQQQLKLEYILETHVHADHLSAAPYIRQQLGGQTGIGSRIHQVQQVFAGIFHTEEGFKTDGSQFDLLLDDGAVLPLGELQIRVIHTPGHAPACVCYQR